VKLYILNGEGRGRTYETRPGITLVGRGPANHIRLEDDLISRKHLHVIREKEKLFIEDLGSKNGTFVNGNKIPALRKVEVREGTPILIGNTFFSLGKRWCGRFLVAQNPGIHAQDTLEVGFPGESKPLAITRHLELVYRVSRVLMESLDIDVTLERILDHIFDIFEGIDRGAILLIDEQTGDISKEICRARENDSNRGVRYSRKTVDRVIKTAQPLIILDTKTQEKTDLSESMEFLRIRSIMCAPLISRSQLRGVIYVDTVEKAYGFTREDLSVLTALSGPAAIAIENATLYSNLERLVQQRTSDLEKTKEKLHQSETRFRAIFDSMSRGVMVYRPVSNGEDFAVLDMNEAARSMEDANLQSSVRKAIEHGPSHLAALNKKLLEILKRVNKTRSPERHLIPIKGAEGEPTYRDYYIYTLPSGELVTIYDDVTARIMAEKEQKALQEQLFQSQKMESVGALAGGIAHNFRNLLQAISGNIEYLEILNPDKPQLLELTRNIRESVKKGADLIGSLLQFSRSDAKYEMTEVDLSEIIFETHGIIKRLFDKNIKIDLHLEKDIYIRGNRTLLSQVFMNLYTNARDAMPQGGVLKIRAWKNHEKAIAVVSDTGHGMDEETMKRIFDPFFSLKQVGKGTGLGLSTSHGIIKQHKGSIHVSSRPGQGASFSIQLPLVQPPDRAGEEKETKKGIVFGKGEKILIIDDDPATLQAITSLVASLGYEAIGMDRPYVALEGYERISPDLVLIDRSMPDIDGFTWISKVKKKDPNARIIVLSGYDISDSDEISGTFKDSIKGYITKPCGIKELSQMISRALRE